MQEQEKISHIYILFQELANNISVLNLYFEIFSDPSAQQESLDILETTLIKIENIIRGIKDILNLKKSTDNIENLVNEGHKEALQNQSYFSTKVEKENLISILNNSINLLKNTYAALQNNANVAQISQAVGKIIQELEDINKSLESMF
ncbi:MAG: hypothetical protein KatS3mg091_098 [Patescibacteria group bacterium]|nr:MAG: hypothetical protein KatS3mg091_098 [Patescibacteria group bacterium]